MLQATKNSNCVPDTDVNESPEESNNLQESISENEVHEDYNRSQIQVQMIQKYFSTPNLPQVIKSEIYQTQTCTCLT